MKKLNNWSYTIIALLISVFHFIPIYITLMVALKSKSDLSSRWSLPAEVAWGNFMVAAEKANLFLAMKNNIIITVISLVFIVILGAMASYPLARVKTKTNSVMTLLFLSVLMVPPLTMMVPLIRLMKQINGISTLWGIIIVLVTYKLPLSIILFKNFIGTLPTALDEAAGLDGCNNNQIFFRIILPLLKPVIATVMIITGVEVWNEFQFSLYLLHSKDVQVSTLAIYTFFGQASSNVNYAAAAALLAILPITLLFLFLQKYFVQGMVDSAVK